MENYKLGTILFLILFLLGSIISCNNETNKILGTWQNKQGQTLIFNRDSSALWLFDSPTGVDTFFINYKTNFDTEPNQLDLYNFQVGPLAGKALFGIVEFTNGSFKCDFEAGTDPEIRPKNFDVKESQTYYRKQ